MKYLVIGNRSSIAQCIIKNLQDDVISLSRDQFISLDAEEPSFLNRNIIFTSHFHPWNEGNYLAAYKKNLEMISTLRMLNPKSVIYLSSYSCNYSFPTLSRFFKWRMEVAMMQFTNCRLVRLPTIIGTHNNSILILFLIKLKIVKGINQDRLIQVLLQSNEFAYRTSALKLSKPSSSIIFRKLQSHEIIARLVNLLFR